jgi:predicted nucleotide-binding protein (sugar kinase/HSP70/actin superfamily)
VKKLDWKWVDDSHIDSEGATAHKGCLKLDVWYDIVWIKSKSGWVGAFDIKNGDEIATSFTKAYKTKEAAQKAAEKLAEKWLDTLEKALKAKTKKVVDSKHKKL